MHVFRREVDGELLRERPSHIFRILLRCNDSRWSADNQTCRDVSETRALAFILPNVPDDLNCLVNFTSVMTFKSFSTGQNSVVSKYTKLLESAIMGSIYLLVVFFTGADGIFVCKYGTDTRHRVADGA